MLQELSQTEEQDKRVPLKVVGKKSWMKGTPEQIIQWFAFRVLNSSFDWRTSENYEVVIAWISHISRKNPKLLAKTCVGCLAFFFPNYINEIQVESINKNDMRVFLVFMDENPLESN